MEQTKHSARGVLRMCHSEGLIICRWATEKKKKEREKENSGPRGKPNQPWYHCCLHPSTKPRK